MSDDKTLLGVRIPTELKDHVDNDPRTNQEVVKDALEREFATKEEAAVLRRMDELDREMAELESQKNDRERKLDEKAEEKERLKKSLKSIEESTTRQKENVLQKAEMIPADPQHPFVIDKAELLDMDPIELAEEIAETYGKELQENNDDNEFDYL